MVSTPSVQTSKKCMPKKVTKNLQNSTCNFNENSSELEVSFKSSSEVYRRTIDTHKSGEFRDFNNGRTEKFTTQACAGNNDHNGLIRMEGDHTEHGKWEIGGEN